MTQALAILNHRPPLEGVIQAWLNARASKSKATGYSYPRVLTAFRVTLQGVHLENGTRLDLDSADPRAVLELLPLQIDLATRDEAMEAATVAIATVAQAWASSDEASSATINRRLAILSSFYTYALKQGLLRGPNPIIRVERRRVQAYANARAIDYDELTHTVQALPRDQPDELRDRALILLALFTGQRAAELAALRWRDADIQLHIIHLTFAHAKGDKVMRKDLPRHGVEGQAARALLAWHAQSTHTLPDQPIFISLAKNTRGWPLSPRSVSRICEERIGHSKVHMLRHTYAHALEDSGAKFSDIQRLLGHANAATTGRYLAALASGQNEHLSKMAALFGFITQDEEGEA